MSVDLYVIDYVVYRDTTEIISMIVFSRLTLKYLYDEYRTHTIGVIILKFGISYHAS